MEQKFTSWLVTENKSHFAPIDYLLIVGTFIAGILLRSTVWMAPLENAPFQNQDTALQIVTTVFDFLAAVFLGIIVHRLTGHKIKALLAYGIGMLLPVMAAGSAMWAMGDSVALFFVLLALYFLLADEKYFVLSLVFYGLAVFLQPNSLFLVPVFIWYYFGKTKAGNAVLGFAAPVLGIVLHILTDQGEKSSFLLFKLEGQLQAARESVLLSYQFPNLYQIIGVDAYVHEYGVAFRYVTIGAVLAAVIVGIRLGRKLSGERIVETAFIFSVAVPWFLPFMDERAGLLAAVLSVVYGFVHIDRFFVPIIQVTLTYLAYAAYFRGESFLPMSGIALVQLGLLLYLLYEAAKTKDRKEILS